MKKLSICFLILFSALRSQHYQVDFPPEEFKARWEGVFEQNGDEAVAVVQDSLYPMDLLCQDKPTHFTI